MENELRNEKKRALEVAKGLLYREDVLEKIENAKTIAEIDRILTTARQSEK